MDVAGGRAYFENWADVSWGCSLFGLTANFLGPLSFRLYLLRLTTICPKPVSFRLYSFGLTPIFLRAALFSALFLWLNYHFPSGSLIFGFIPSD
ncbi:hypothetical protein C1N70_12595 [Cytobacillus firmus]